MTKYRVKEEYNVTLSRNVFYVEKRSIFSWNQVTLNGVSAFYSLESAVKAIQDVTKVKYHYI